MEHAATVIAGPAVPANLVTRRRVLSARFQHPTTHPAHHYCMYNTNDSTMTIYFFPEAVTQIERVDTIDILIDGYQVPAKVHLLIES